MDKRTALIKGLIIEKKLDAVLVSDLASVRYHTGFSGSSALLLVSPDEVTLLTDGRYETQAGLEVKNAGIIIYRKKLDELASLLKEKGWKRIGFESKVLSFFEWRELEEKIKPLELVPLKDELKKLRCVKDKSELEIIRRGCNIALESFKAVIDSVREGKREKDIAWSLEIELRKRGADRPSFDIIVASGANSALPHARPGNKALTEGDLVVVDFGAAIEGYHTDETCTVRVGTVPEKCEEIYNIILEAHDRAIGAVRPGVSLADVDRVAREFIDKKGFGSYFGHGTGHGVGLEIHELPVVSALGDQTVEEGMVFTVEPGIYIPGLGGVRIEDMVYAGAGGAEILTRCNEYLRGN